MTWDRLSHHYLLKFRLNLHKKSCGIPSDSNLYKEFLQEESTPISKENVLSVACQFYDPTGLAAPLMFPVQALFSEICRDCSCSMTSIPSEERTVRFCTAVSQILLTKDISFPRQIILSYTGQLYTFFDGSLQG